jgi:hypothetical protein
VPIETVRKGGTSNAPSMDLASMRRKKWAERPLFGVLLDHAAGAFGTFRTVSLGWTLANWPCNTPHRLGLLRAPLGLFASHSPTTTRKKSP